MNTCTCFFDLVWTVPAWKAWVVFIGAGAIGFTAGVAYGVHLMARWQREQR